MENSKNTKVMIVIAIVVFIVVAVITAFNTFNRMEREEQDVAIISGETSGDNTSEEININESFLIDKTHIPQNREKLERFLAEVSAGEVSNLRVEMETPDSLFSIVDIKASGDTFFVTQDNTQISGDIQENIYEEYFIKDEIIIIEEGVELQSYYLYNEALENRIELFAYLIETINPLEDIQNNDIESGEQEKIIEISE